MKPEIKSKVIFGVSGLICGGILAMVIGFSWGGWTTSGATKIMAQKAVVASKAEICIAQFVEDPNYTENLKTYEKLDSYGMNNTIDYLKKIGWDRMPGEVKASLGVADACGIGIEALIKKL